MWTLSSSANKLSLCKLFPLQINYLFSSASLRGWYISSPQRLSSVSAPCLSLSPPVVFSNLCYSFYFFQLARHWVLCIWNKQQTNKTSETIVLYLGLHKTYQKNYLHSLPCFFSHWFPNNSPNLTSALMLYGNWYLIGHMHTVRSTRTFIIP